MADEKPQIDEDIAALITEALISVEAAGVGLESMIAREGAKPGLVEASRRLEIVKVMLVNLSDFTKPEGDANG